ncbi:filamin-binding LIM protein 1 isoform X1 [Petaurus breviceps papuanus]|uniref:filamin-binding LIM protein 1 isoform X1 n=1 Tax=Petaurus breviceps papuanus TaxID=3040969 RepID=UPI0036D9926E
MMAAKPEKRMASSIFITLTPPRRDTAVVDEVRQAACSSRVSRAREPALAKKPPGDFLVGRQGPQVPSIPAAPVLLPNGGSALPRPAPDAEDSFPDLDLLPPPPPPPAFLLPPEEEGLTQGGDSLSEDLQQLHVVPPPPPPQALPEPHQLKLRPNHLKGVEEELPPPPEEPDRVPGREESTDICAFCHKVVSPQELAVEAMKRQYHAQCFTCRACHRQLAGQCFYQKDGRPLCESCYQDTLEKCGRCQTVALDHVIRALGQTFHPDCFTCVVCSRRIGDESFALDEQNEVYCLDDFYRKFAPVCSICENPIIPRDGKDVFKIECMGRNFHENCYRCEDCRILLSVEPTDQGCYPLNDHLFCKPCHVKRSAAGCC